MSGLISYGYSSSAAQLRVAIVYNAALVLHQMAALVDDLPK